MSYRTKVKVYITPPGQSQGYRDQIFETTVETSRGTPAEVKQILKATYPHMRQFALEGTEKVSSGSRTQYSGSAANDDDTTFGEKLLGFLIIGGILWFFFGG